jgi:glycosyltransferase involved in cell wall biosynthesis
LRLAILHSYYSSRQPSGENVAVDAQVRWLRQAGHEVELIAQHTDDRELRRTYPIEAALTVATGRGASPLRALKAFRPDVVHVHNLFPNWGTEWLSEWHSPVVATVHNFRPVCAAGTLFRAGSNCTECLDHSRWAGLKHGCYRSSRVATLPLAVHNRRGVGRDPLLSRADRVIVLSNTARDIYARAGVSPERLTVIPNAVEDPGEPLAEDRVRDTWLYVGRLSEEKGPLELLSEWPEHERLDIVGAGPLQAEVERYVTDRVRYLGVLRRDELRQRMSPYLGLVFPSRCLEQSPVTVPEALAAGLPIVARAGNAAADLVALHGAGAVVSVGAAWSAALSSVREDHMALSRKARDVYLSSFTPRTLVAQLENVYRSLV